MKIESVSFHQPVRLCKTQITRVDSDRDKKYELSFVEGLVKIKRLDVDESNVAYVGLANVVYMITSEKNTKSKKSS